MADAIKDCPACFGTGQVWLPVGRVYAACECTRPAMPFPCAPAIAAAMPQPVTAKEIINRLTITDEMERAAADTLNRRLAERSGLHGVAREILEAALAAAKKGLSDVE